MTVRLTSPRLLTVAAVLGGIASAGAAVPSDLAQLDFFEKKIRPVLSEQCYECHSATSKKVKGGLLLDTAEGVLKGGDSGPAVVPGKPDDSMLVMAIRQEDELKMPPKKKLADQQIKDIETWIKMGAPYPESAAPTAVAAPTSSPAICTRNVVASSFARSVALAVARAKISSPRARSAAATSA